MTGSSGELLSPNYPMHYDALSFCDWFLTAENGGRIAMMINDIQTEKSNIAYNINLMCLKNRKLYISFLSITCRLGLCTHSRWLCIEFSFTS